jgi:hypothetical protein
MLAPGQRGRSSRWSDDHPGLRVTPRQGGGPQPIARVGHRGRIALGGLNGIGDSLSRKGCYRGIAGCAKRRLSGLVGASSRPLLEKGVWRDDSTQSCLTHHPWGSNRRRIKRRMIMTSCIAIRRHMRP